MKIIKISQSLGFELYQEPNDFNGDALTKTTELIKKYNKNFKNLIDNAKSNGYNSLQEMLLIDIFPALKPYLEAYYKDKGKQMIKTLNDKTIKKIDDHLFAFLNILIDNNAASQYSVKNPNGSHEMLVEMPNNKSHHLSKENPIDYQVYLETLKLF